MNEIQYSFWFGDTNNLAGPISNIRILISLYSKLCFQGDKTVKMLLFI